MEKEVKIWETKYDKHRSAMECKEEKEEVWILMKKMLMMKTCPDQYCIDAKWCSK